MLDLFDSSVVVTLLPEQNDGFIECGLSVVTGDSYHAVQLIDVAVQSESTTFTTLHRHLKAFMILNYILNDRSKINRLQILSDRSIIFIQENASMPTFTFHDIQSAPEQSKPLLEGSLKAFGMILGVHAVMAEPPPARKC